MYLIDVGIEQPVNAGVVGLKLSRPSVPVGGQVQVTAALKSFGALRSEQSVELWLQAEDGKPAKRDQQTIAWPATGDAEATFAIDGVTGNYAQAEVRLVTSDPLNFDNAAFFTVRVVPPLDVLVVVEQNDHAVFLLQALNGLNAGGAGYRPTLKRASELLDVDLAKFDIVCLLNAAQPSESVWQRLGEYVRNGGGVAVFLGAPSALNLSAGRRGIDPVAYKSDAAQEWLPAQLTAELTFAPPRQLDFRESSHPLTQRLDQLGVLSLLGDVDFRRYWKVTPHESALTLARWNDDGGQPALMVRDVGRGRSVIFASSIDSTAWNDLPFGWPFLALTDQLLQMLSRQATASHTLRVGDPVVLPIAPPDRATEALLRLPDFTQRRLDVDAGAREIDLSAMTQLGHYQVAPANGPKTDWLAAFSVNPISGESDLRRLKEADLDDLLGPKRYGVARDPQTLTRSVNTGRLGQEVYGLLMAGLLVVFAWEQATATWFYRADEK